MVHLQFTKLLWCPLQVGKIIRRLAEMQFREGCSVEAVARQADDSRKRSAASAHDNPSTMLNSRYI